MKPWLFIGLSEAALTAAYQAGAIPEGLIPFLTQLPFIAVLIWLDVQNKKWLEKMLQIQRDTMREIYSGQNSFVSSLIERIKAAQERTDSNVAALTKEVSILRATIGEVAKVDDVIDQLMDRIDRGINHKGER